jgi:hypothetical protein
MEIDNTEEVKRKAHSESEIVKKKTEEDVELMKSLVKDKVITTKPTPKPRNRPVSSTKRTYHASTTITRTPCKSIILRTITEEITRPNDKQNDE